MNHRVGLSIDEVIELHSDRLLPACLKLNLPLPRAAENIAQSCSVVSVEFGLLKFTTEE
jgi:hypothetical protein